MGFKHVKVSDTLKNVKAGDTFKNVKVGDTFKNIKVGDTFKNIKVGDTLILKNDNNLYIIDKLYGDVDGKYYHIYNTISFKQFWIDDSFYTCFYTKKEIRKLKLEKLNINSEYKL